MIKKCLMMICCIFMLSSCSLLSKQKHEQIELTPKEVLNKLQDPKQNSFLLYLTADSCYSCSQYENVIASLEKQQPFEIYYFKINPNEEDKETKKIMDELQITTGKYQDLPMTYYFYQGTLLPENKKDGYIEEKDMRKWLQNLHIIK